MKKIAQNPYIVGNPIKTKEMFFGREDDFLFISRKIGMEKANQVIILCGERRSGKTSILFQILSGRLGDEFLPVLIDMQILAGIKSDLEFFKAVVESGCDQLRLPGLTLEGLLTPENEANVEKLFRSFLEAVGRAHPAKVLLFLLDEYELLEAKIKDNILSESVVHLLSGILEGNRRVSFIFTGSTNLENRKVDFWKALLGKSIYRKISYLSPDDTRRLITEPLADAVFYPEEVITRIYRLTGGQPFYTQVICQNLVDVLLEEERNDPAGADLEQVVKDIIENPLPQMIYSWNSLSDWTKFALASLAGNLENARARSDMGGVYRFLKNSKILLPFKRERINVFLEEAYQKEFLEKDEENAFAFRMDIYRRWIRKEHSIWKVIKEVNLEVKQQRRFLGWAALAAGALAMVVLLMVLFMPAPGQTAGNTQGVMSAVGKISGVKLASNQAPFRVTIDEVLTLTSEGQADPRTIILPPLDRGVHTLLVVNQSSGEKITLTAAIDETTRVLTADFKQAAAQAAGSLFIATVPDGARIWLDGKDRGLSPQILDGIAAGSHTLALERDGYKKNVTGVVVKENQTTQHKITLAPAFGFLALIVTPTAKIYLDGAYLVDTPLVKPVQVPVGRHKLKMVNESLGVSIEDEITVREDETLKIERALR